MRRGSGLCISLKIRPIVTKDFALSWGLIILSALFDSYAAFIVKMKFNQAGPIDFSSITLLLAYFSKWLRSPLLLTALATFLLAPGLWFFALNRIDLSVGYPTLVGFHLLFVLIFGIFFLGEAFTPQKAMGVLLIVLSLYFLFKS